MSEEDNSVVIVEESIANDYLKLCIDGKAEQLTTYLDHNEVLIITFLFNLMIVTYIF